MAHRTDFMQEPYSRRSTRWSNHHWRRIRDLFRRRLRIRSSIGSWSRGHHGLQRSSTRCPLFGARLLPKYSAKWNRLFEAQLQLLQATVPHFWLTVHFDSYQHCKCPIEKEAKNYYFVKNGISKTLERKKFYLNMWEFLPFNQMGFLAWW